MSDKHYLCLIVEDEPEVRKLMADILADAGFDVEAAIDGESALALLTQLRPAVILCDIRLPGIDGHEVARRVRADPLLRRVPIVAVTAFAEEDKLRAAGFSGCVVKPLKPALFPLQVREVIAEGNPDAMSASGRFLMWPLLVLGALLSAGFLAAAMR